MWRYQLTCLCGGWGQAIIGASLVVMFFAMHFIEYLDDPLIFLACLLGIPAVGLLVAFIVTHIPKPEDERQIMDAEPIHWRKLLAQSPLIRTMQKKCRSDFIIILILGVFLALCSGFFFYTAHIDTNAIFPGVVISAIAVVSVLIVWVQLMFWRNCTGEMEYAIVPVAECRKLPNLNRRMHMPRYMAIFYLPSGKYRVELYTYQPPEKLYFIRWHGIVQRVNWQEN